MALTPLAKLGSLTDHGGVVTQCFGKALVDGELIARVGDIVSCPIHGQTVITEGVFNVQDGGIEVAHVGSATSCGAKITTGASGVNA